MERKEKPENGAGPAGQGLKYLQIGTVLTAPVILGVLAGNWLDRRFGTGPWITLGGALLGMAAGFAEFFRIVLPKGR